MEQNHKTHVQIQNSRGRCTQQEIWVLGMVDTSAYSRDVTNVAFIQNECNYAARSPLQK